MRRAVGGKGGWKVGWVGGQSVGVERGRGRGRGGRGYRLREMHGEYGLDA